MAIALRAASSDGTPLGTSWPITYPAGSAVGDYVFVVLGLGNAAGSFNTGPFGDMSLLSTDTNSGDPGGYYTGLYGGLLTSTTGPTITSTTSGNKGAWVAIAFSGTSLTLDGAVAKTINTVTNTSHTPPAKTATQASVVSILLHSARNSATGATGPTTTPPTNWTEPASGDVASSAGTTSANRQVGCAVSYRLAQSGTITPGALTLSLTGFADLYHVLLYEAAGAPAVIPYLVMAPSRQK